MHKRWPFHAGCGFERQLIAAPSPAAVTKDGMGRRTGPTAVVTIAAPLVAAIIVAAAAVVVAPLMSNLPVILVPVAADVTALVARQRAVRAITAPFLPNLATALSQLPRFISGNLPGANAAADSPAITAPLSEGIGCYAEKHDYRAQ